MMAFLQRTLHNVLADTICVEHLTRCERDTQPARNDQVRLHIACSGAESDAARPQGRTSEKVEHRVAACCAARWIGTMVCRGHATHTMCVGISAAFAGVIPSKGHYELEGMA
jgi:hypothetical protein